MAQEQAAGTGQALNLSHIKLPDLPIQPTPLIGRERESPLLKAPPAQARGVLSGASTLLRFPSWRGTAALVWLRSEKSFSGWCSVY